jgi:hypothetical protein
LPKATGKRRRREDVQFTPINQGVGSTKCGKRAAQNEKVAEIDQYTEISGDY